MNHLQPLIIESVQLMLTGMGTVFLILIMLIFLINFVSKMLSSFDLDDSPVKSDQAVSITENSAKIADHEHIAVISAAISTYRKNHPAN